MDLKKNYKHIAANSTDWLTIQKPTKHNSNKIEMMICCIILLFVGSCVFIFAAPYKPILYGTDKMAIGIEKPIVKWQPKATEAQQYIKRFATTAQQEQRKFGIPASITLAQGILESKMGRSGLAKRNNNHFGIKCFSKNCPKGHCSNHTDDSHKDFFRKYNSAWESYRAHSLFIAKGRYKALCGGYDIEVWTEGLQRLGYATSKTYAKDLLKIIKDYDLEFFDKHFN